MKSEKKKYLNLLIDHREKQSEKYLEFRAKKLKVLYGTRSSILQKVPQSELNDLKKSL
jgi:hypothetical protein